MSKTKHVRVNSKEEAFFHELRDTGFPIEHQPWYFGNISDNELIPLFSQQADRGTYIIRTKIKEGKPVRCITIWIGDKVDARNGIRMKSQYLEGKQPAPVVDIDIYRGKNVCLASVDHKFDSVRDLLQYCKNVNVASLDPYKDVELGAVHTSIPFQPIKGAAFHNEFIDSPLYMGDVTTEDCVAWFRNVPKGCFMIRRNRSSAFSENSSVGGAPSDDVHLSVRSDDQQVIDFPISKFLRWYRLMPTQQFDSIENLIEFYQKHNLLADNDLKLKMSYSTLLPRAQVQFLAVNGDDHFFRHDSTFEDNLQKLSKHPVTGVFALHKCRQSQVIRILVVSDSVKIGPDKILDPSCIEMASLIVEGRGLRLSIPGAARLFSKLPELIDFYKANVLSYKYPWMYRLNQQVEKILGEPEHSGLHCLPWCLVNTSVAELQTQVRQTLTETTQSETFFVLMHRDEADGKIKGMLANLIMFAKPYDLVYSIPIKATPSKGVYLDLPVFRNFSFSSLPAMIRHWHRCGLLGCPAGFNDTRGITEKPTGSFEKDVFLGEFPDGVKRIAFPTAIENISDYTIDMPNDAEDSSERVMPSGSQTEDQ